MMKTTFPRIWFVNFSNFVVNPPAPSFRHDDSHELSYILEIFYTKYDDRTLLISSRSGYTFNAVKNTQRNL